MGSKRVDPLKAKEAKQKKIAIGGAVLLLALLGFQGPKTLKMLKGPQPVAAPASTTTLPTTTTPAAGAPAAGGAEAGGVAAPAPELSAVADSDASPEAEEGQLATFERFASKDPFEQQAEPPEAAPAAAPASQPNAGTAAKPTSATNEDTAASDGAAVKDGDSPDSGFSTGSSANSAPELAAATSISVNGVAAEVAVDESFPKDEPTFVLVKTAENGKSVQIGIAGGEYADGGKTMTLALGQKITLQNTVDGSRYELELLAVQGHPVPKRK
jgi:hypothetical protein